MKVKTKFWVTEVFPHKSEGLKCVILHMWIWSCCSLECWWSLLYPTYEQTLTRWWLITSNFHHWVFFLAAPCGLWGAARPQPLHAVSGLTGCGPPPGPAAVSAPRATFTSSMPTGVWHRHLVCQRMGLVGLFLHNSEDGRGSGSWGHLPWVVLCTWPGTGAKGWNDSADGEGGCCCCCFTMVVYHLLLPIMIVSLLCFQDNSKWGSGIDEQIMSWATSRPEVIQNDPSCALINGFPCSSWRRHW